ncbi:CG7252, partial [Drosophila busckii]
FSALLGLLLCVLIPNGAYAQYSNACADEEDGTRLPLLLSCSRFIVCMEREISEMRNCPRGLHFNPELRECDFQWRAGCTALSLFGTGTADADDDCTCTCCQEECQSTTNTTPCPPSGGTTKSSESVDDNTKSTSSSAATPTGSTDAPATDSSDDDVTNTDATQATDVTEGTAATDVTDVPQNTDDPADILVPAYCSDKRSSCVNKDNGAMLPVSGFCTNYIQCNHGCCTEFTCPSGLWFNPEYNNCDYFWNVDSCIPNGSSDTDGEIVGPSGTTCSDQGVCAGKRDGYMCADPKTNGYFVCQCQCPKAMPCDKNTKFNETAQVCDWDKAAAANVLCPNGLVYNATSSQCDYPEGYVPKVVCNNTETICQGKEEGTLFPMEGVCNKFYKCNYNCAVEQDCPNNLLYDSNTQLCDYPQNVNCKWPHSPPSGPNAGPSGISCESNGRCLGQNEGTIFPSEKNCGSYSICQCECEVEMSCPDGLYWDTTYLTCNYANLVKCNL